MENEAGGGTGVIGDAGAGGHGRIGVAGARHDDRDGVSSEQSAQVLGEREGDGFFVESGGEFCSDVGAAVGRVDDYHEAGSRVGRESGWKQHGGRMSALGRGCERKQETAGNGGAAQGIMEAHRWPGGVGIALAFAVRPPRSR